MSSRVSLSRRATKKVKYAEEIDSESDGTSSELDNPEGSKVEKRKAKATEEVEGSSADEYGKQSTKRKKSKGRKGKRDQRKKKGCSFDRLPVEVVTEILSHLEPKDLLTFSRTNKSCRSILMSKKQSNRIWKLARRKFNLPDLTAEDFSEPAYAALLWDTQCDNCSLHRPAAAEFWLRVRLCNACRKLKMIRIDSRVKKDPSYHPATFDCVKRTPCAPNNISYSDSTAGYALIEEVAQVNQQLWQLQEADNEDKALASQDCDTYQEAEQSDHRSTRREGLRKRRAPVLYKENDEGSAWVRIKEGGRVAKFVEGREEVLEKVYEDGSEMSDAFYDARISMREERKRAWMAKSIAEDKRMRLLRKHLENRFAKVEGYDRWDLSLISRQLGSLVRTGGVLSDERWEAVRPRLLAAIDQVRAEKRSEEREKAREARADSRRASLRAHYEALKASSGDGLCFPLFADFTVFPSVRALWDNSDEDIEEDDFEETDSSDDDGEPDIVDEPTWKAILPFVKAELDEYHLDFITKALRLILSAQREFDDEEDLVRAVDSTLEGDLDSFLSLATSLVVCEECRGIKTQRTLVTSDGVSQTYRKRSGGFLGSVIEVADHLFAEHNSSGECWIWHWRVPEPKIPICLPHFVALTVSSLLELGQYSPSQATTSDLDRLDSSGSYIWQNHPYKAPFGQWRHLVDEVSAAASRTKLPSDLAIPEIVYRPARKSAPTPTLDDDPKDS